MTTLTSSGVREARDRYVSAAVTPPPLVVTAASGARIEADDGCSYIDFAGGIGCQNLGHGAPDVVEAKSGGGPVVRAQASARPVISGASGASS